MKLFIDRYLASGNTFTDLHYSFRLGISTISSIVKQVCEAIWRCLQKECLPTPKKESWENISTKFQKYLNFPNCLGAVDGKHIRIMNPTNSSSMYFNARKRYSSILLMAVADAEYKFIYVDVGNYDKDSDSAIFNDSSLWKAIVNGTSDIPIEKSLPGTTSAVLPHFFIGDEAFQLHRHLLRPYGGRNLSLKKKVFNYRLNRARRCVECTFAILSNKCRIFHRPINLEPNFAVSITKACVVLHNFIRDRDGYDFEDTLLITGLHDANLRDMGGMSRGGANNIRDFVADYFLSDEGALSWQLSKI